MFLYCAECGTVLTHATTLVSAKYQPAGYQALVAAQLINIVCFRDILTRKNLRISYGKISLQIVNIKHASVPQEQTENEEFQ